MSDPGGALLKTEAMTKRFGGLVAVDSLDLDVKEGSIHSIIGPNGAGKTTVFNCIMEFYTPDEGASWFAGERIDGVTPDRVAAAGINRAVRSAATSVRKSRSTSPISERSAASSACSDCKALSRPPRLRGMRQSALYARCRRTCQSRSRRFL